MELADAVKSVKFYREMARDVCNYSSQQIAMDALTLDILDGDVEKLREYREAAQNIANSSYEQIAFDALHLALIVNPKGKGLSRKIEED